MKRGGFLMKRYSVTILRLALFIAGLVVLALCGGAAWQVIKMVDPSSEYYIWAYVLLAGTCSASIPCFIALFQSYKLLNYIETDRVFSDLSVKALKMITRAAFADFIICTVGGLPFFYVMAQMEDAPGLVLIGMAIAGVAFVIYVFSYVLNRLLQNAIAMKSENDLTI
jgi:hypothetical protein